MNLIGVIEKLDGSLAVLDVEEDREYTIPAEALADYRDDEGHIVDREKVIREVLIPTVEAGRNPEQLN